MSDSQTHTAPPPPQPAPRPAATTSPARIVPALGLSSLLMVLASAAMVFLCALALAFAFAAARTADDWQAQIARALTVRIDAPPDRIDALTEQALSVLGTTGGIGETRVISDAEAAALLDPWVPNPALLQTFDLPRMIAVSPSGAPLDTTSLSLRLAGEVPGATLDDHSGWLAPLQAAAARASGLSVAIGAVALFGLVAIVLVAAQAAMTSHRGIIQTLRLLGARDGFIASAFVRGMTLRALIGAGIGILLGALTLLILPGGGNGSGIFTALRFQGAEWLALIALVPLTGALAFVATLAAAHVILRRTD